MSLHVEWMGARDTRVGCALAGAVIGEYVVDGECALVFRDNEVVVIEGDREDLRRLLREGLSALDCLPVREEEK
jgi:hypothetical protein